MVGYKVVTKSNALESFTIGRTKSVVEKRFSAPPVEISTYRYNKYVGVFIDGTQDQGAVKTYFVLSGSCRHAESETVLSAGDGFVIGMTEDIHNLHMLEETTILVHAIGTEAYAEKAATTSLFVKTLARIQEKDHYTETHCYRVYELAYNLARRLGWAGIPLFVLTRAARYHDIGKIHVPDAILCKRGNLDSSERALMQGHVTSGGEFIAELHCEAISQVVSQHHERLDGSGYPLGLKGREISPGGRILAICDCFDAMTAERVYKTPKTIEESLSELESFSGIAYDPEMVDAFCSMIRAKEEGPITDLLAGLAWDRPADSQRLTV